MGCCGFCGGGSGGGTITAPTAVPTWFPCLNFDFSEFLVAATTKSNLLFSLLPRMTIEDLVIKTSIVFAGAGITTLNFNVGIAGDLARYCSRYDALIAPSDVNFGSSDLFFPEDFSASASILLSVVSVGANLSALTQGHGCVWVKGALLPSP
jgi:hypothetical protein